MPFDLNPDLLKHLKDEVNISPNGVAFVKPEVRVGTLKRMLTEILDTRIMVKDSMKRYKNNKSLLRCLDSRQLGLKFIANVTYGYTSASFSGRMPCVDIADSIVQTGREILERAIQFINEHAQWNARVVYGDTDSLFVYLPGSSRDRAFDVGREIADAITNMNPAPIKLKFEKVYHPCVLLSKKRYVGFKYEAKDQTAPDFDAKGIETIRRDSCPVVAKTLECSLKILFRTQDLSELKQYLQEQWVKIFAERVSIQDFMFGKEVKLGTYSDRGVPPPGVFMCLERMKRDPRAAPEYAERVPYVIQYQGPDSRLADCARRPEEAALDSSFRLHAEYYITKQIIPALSRIFSLFGVDLTAWYAEIPRVHRSIRHTHSNHATLLGIESKTKKTIEHFYKSSHCVSCGALSITGKSNCHRISCEIID